jgi:hypothetical protein
MPYPTAAQFVKALAVPALLLTLAAPAWSQEEPPFAKTGVYVGASNVFDFALDGLTFDGSSYYKQVDGDEILILPRLERKSAMRALVGFRSRRGAFEVSYDQTNHRGTFLDAPGEATFHALNGDERIFALTRHRIQPYGLLGLSVQWLTIKDGSYLEPNIGNATFRGMGVNMETGVMVYPVSRVGISTGYRYRAMWFDRATGVGDREYELRPRFRETSGSLVVTALFTF